MSNKRAIIDELHKQARKNFKRRRVITKGIDDLWQADLVEMGAYASKNKGFRFLLTVIDTFSKYAWTRAIKSKNATSVSHAMREIFKQGRKPRNLQTDDGKEFFNKEFQHLMKINHVNHYSTFSIMKASIVERFNRTLKGMMWKEFSLHGNYCWIDKYKKLTDEYNSRKHRIIKMAPRSVNKLNEKTLLQTVYNHLKVMHKPKFRIGQNVRISKHKHIFEKGYTPNWTTEIFKIKSIQITNPVTYILEDYEGNPIKGGFYEYELLKTKYPHIYLVEKVLKTNGAKAYVKWLGFSKEHNSWINKKDIL